MSQIIKNNTSEVEKPIDEEIKVGDLFIHNRNEEIVKVRKIEENKVFLSELTSISNGTWVDKIRYYTNGTPFDDTTSLESLKNYYKKCTQQEFDEWLELEAEFLETGSLEKFQKAIPQSNETDIVQMNGTGQLSSLQKNMESKSVQLEGMKRIIELKKHEHEKKLRQMKSKLDAVLDVFKKEISKIMQVISTIEIYLGINEELFQIQEGEKASLETPITFRQQILFMDEEVAVTDDGGWDIHDIPKFDEWLVKNANYKTIVPEEKCVVVFKPRRYEKDYRDSYANATMKGLNESTYILIRNGANLYRIYSDNIDIRGRLFPLRKELEKLSEKLDGKSKDEIDQTLLNYKKRAILMQGLIDRTDILHPVKENISVFKMDENPECFNFVYDDEITLPSGRLPFRQWKNEINEKIQHGSRIITSSTDLGEYFQERLYGKYTYSRDKYSLPTRPESDIYDVEKYQVSYVWNRCYQKDIDKLIEDGHKVKVSNKKYNTERFDIVYFDKREDLTFLYHAKGDVYDVNLGDYRPMKNRVRFKFYTDDSFVLNYDEIRLEDVNFYLSSRVDRPNYLKMIPLLKKIKKERLKELELESAFCDMVYAVLSAKVSHPKLKEIIWEQIDWWKFKNKIKRAIEKDDAKALRMIEKQVLNKINE